MNLVVFLSVFLLTGGNRAQPLEPSLPVHIQPIRYNSLFKGVNECAYAEVVPAESTPSIKAWTCGLISLEKSDRITYDCCPGYIRTGLVNNECAERNPTYLPLTDTLLSMKFQDTSEALSKGYPALDQINGKDYTVFVPLNDSSFLQIPDEKLATQIVDGRKYSNSFKNGATIRAANDYPLKVSTSPNGLVFVECQVLAKPDYETKNGLIHIVSGPLTDAKSHLSLLQRLQEDSDTSEFVADIPSDIRSLLRSEDSKDRFTVFAPTNSAWRQAKRQANPKALVDLVRQHIVDGMICGLSIDREERLLGPSKSNSYYKAVQNLDGSRVIVDACGNSVKIEKMDIMAMNGVIHKLENELQTTSTMDLNGALSCLSNGPKNELSEAAGQMAGCMIQVSQGENVVVLLPTNDALNGIASDVHTGSRCQVYQNNVLSSQNCLMKNPHGTGVSQECEFTSKYTAPGGSKQVVTNQYIRTREGSRIHFGKAVTTGVKPIAFRDGVIYSATSLNPPPTKTIIEIIKETPELSRTYEKLQKSGFSALLNRKLPNVVFLAPQNHGWSTREKENKFNPKQLQTLFGLHTLPHQLLTGLNGNIEAETIQTINSISEKPIKIKRTLDGNTFIGYDGLDPNYWSLAIGEPKMALDGVVWVVDWPLVCKNC